MSPASIAERLGLALARHKAGRLAEAAALYRDVLAAQPSNFDALHLLGALRRREGDTQAAVTLISAALALRPDVASAYTNLGSALLDRGEIDAAIAAYRAALTLDPGAATAHRNLLAALLYRPGMSPDERFAHHSAFAARHEPPAAEQLPEPGNEPDPERPLRIGILSSDLRAHSVGRTLMSLLRWRDRATAHVVCYAEGATLDAYATRLRALSDAWRETADLSDREVASLVRADRIDVLLVTAARFDANRPLVACYCPAPVQLSIFDGATTALRGLDYWVSDPVLTPPGTTERFAETVVHLPALLVQEPFETAPPVAPLPAARAGHLTFGAFNNPAKIGDATCDLWARVLRAIPRSRLLFKYHARYADPILQTRLRIGFGGRGVVPDRLAFLATDDGQRAHLAAYDAVDVALDTLPFSGIL